MTGLICYVYMFGAENADTEEAVEAIEIVCALKFHMRILGKC